MRGVELHRLAGIVLAGVAALSVAVHANSTASGQELIGLPPTGDHSTARANAVSADGSTVVGTMGASSVAARGFVWTEADGVANLGGVADGDAPNENWFTANGISGDGTVVVGAATAPLLAGASAGRHAYLWTSSGGFIDLGTLGGLVSEANGISSNGVVVVGAAYDGTGTALPFRWTEREGMSDLGTLEGQTSGSAAAASFDGSVIVGTVQAGGARAFRWTQQAGIEQLQTIPKPFDGAPAPYAWATDVSDDGNIIAGASGVYQTVAVGWNDGVLFQLGSIANAFGASQAHGISGNGLVIVGEGQDQSYTYRGFRWTDDEGMLTVEDWLRAEGAIIASNVTRIARATNCDGSVVVGELTDGQAFVARGSGTGSCSETPYPPDPDPDPSDSDPGESEPTDPPSGGPGLIGLDDLGASLGGTGAASASTVQGLGLIINGAGSGPLDRRSAPGRLLSWIGGDIARDGHDQRDGTSGLGEVGLGYNFGPLQFNATVGLSGGHYDTVHGGSTDLTSGFVKAGCPACRSPCRRRWWRR